jgi:predicted dienelactone hydrolase
MRPRYPTMAMLIVGLLAVPAVGAAASSAAAPAARYAVGVRTEPFVDTSRPTPPNGSFPGSPTRPLPTLVFYPARGRPGPTDHSSAAVAAGSFPLVVFAHGNGSNGAAYEPLLRQWAAAGYVIAAPTFPLSSQDAPGGGTITDYTHQPGDVSFVITSMLRLDRAAGSPFHGVLAAGRVGVVGHSLGGATVLGVAANSCCADPRVRAAVSIDGLELPFGNGQFFAGRTVPFLFFHGDADQTIPYSSSVQAYSAAPPPKLFVTLHGAPHTAFRQQGDATAPPPPWEPVIVQSTLDFLARYLRNDTAALARLRRDATVPGVASLQDQAG